MVRIFLSLLAVALLTPGCEKKSTYVISGVLRDSCGGSFHPKAPVDLHQSGTSSFSASGQTLLSTVGPNGRFSFLYESASNANITISAQNDRGNCRIMSEIPKEESFDLGDTYYKTTVNFYISLNVSNPYTSNDTLYIKNFHEPGNSYKKIAGPFHSGIVDTAYKYWITDPVFSREKTVSFSFNWRINYAGQNNIAEGKICPCDTKTVSINL
jgi:hypothetical protein